MDFQVKTTWANSGGGELSHIVRSAGYISMASLHANCQDCWQLVEVIPLRIRIWWDLLGAESKLGWTLSLPGRLTKHACEGPDTIVKNSGK